MNILDLAKRTLELAEEATPWSVCKHDSHLVESAGECSEPGNVARACSATAAQFIVHTRTAAPQLADAVVSLHSTVAALRDALTDILNGLSPGNDVERLMFTNARELLTKLEGE